MALIDLKTNLAKRIEYDKQDLSTQRVSNAESNYDKFQSDDGQFIQKDIGERYRNTKNDGGLFRGGIALQAERSIEDAERVGKFLGTGKGRIFTLKQLFLQSKNASKNTRIYNPLSTIVSLPNNITQQRHVNTGDGTLGGFLGGLIGFPSKKKSGKGAAVTLFSKDRKGTLQVRYDGLSPDIAPLNKLDNNTELPKDFIKFKFAPMEGTSVANANDYIIFRAYIDGLTESVSPSWASTQYVGKSDPVYNYEGAERTVSFNLKLAAGTALELDAIYSKVHKLTSLCYPEYMQDSFLQSGTKTQETENGLQQVPVFKTRQKPPLIRFRIGELYGNSWTNGKTKDGVMAVIDSLSYTYPDNSTWEWRRGQRVPKLIDVAFTLKIIHEETPHKDSIDFYGYYPTKLYNYRNPKSKKGSESGGVNV